MTKRFTFRYIYFGGKKMKKLFIIMGAVIAAIIACATNPYTGKSTMALVNNDSLLASSFSEYKQFLNQNAVVASGADAAMVERVGNRIRLAAEKWAASEGQSKYLEKYEWEYHLVRSGEVNAWCMPGGKIVVYTGILPVTRDETGLAVVLGHEVAHALLNHGQQRASANVLQQVGAIGVGVATSSENVVAAYTAGSTILGTLPFSRSHESEADHIGLILMTIAGYNPDLSVNFWERMASLGGGGTPQFLSTHPSDETRIGNLKKWIPEANEKAGEIGKIN
jgi:predicted Zn-dependent protease